MRLTQIKGKILNELKSSPKLAVYLSIAAICVIVLLMLRSPDGNEETAVHVPNEQITYAVESYSEELERRLKEVISEIQGVGDVTVMLTIEGTEEKIYVSDISESDSKHETETVVIGSKEALLKATKYPEVRGVLVVCSGGDKPTIQEKVVNAVSTVLDIPTSKVYVTNAK